MRALAELNQILGENEKAVMIAAKHLDFQVSTEILDLQVWVSDCIALSTYFL